MRQLLVPSSPARQDHIQCATHAYQSWQPNSSAIDQRHTPTATENAKARGLRCNTKSKVEILSALCNQTVDRLIELTGPPRSNPADELKALIAGQARLAARHPELVLVYESEERSLLDDLRRRARRRQREHAERWIAALTAIRLGKNRIEVEIIAFAAIGLLLSASRWPKSLRTDPSLERHLCDAALRSIGKLRR